MLCSECHLMVCMLLWKVYNRIFTVCYVRSVVFVYVSIALSVKAIWNCLLDFFQNGCSFQASCSVALLFSSSIVLLLYYDAFSFDKFIDSHDLLLPLSHNNRYPYVTGTSVIALKYKDGVIMACDTGGWSQFLWTDKYHYFDGELNLMFSLQPPMDQLWDTRVWNALRQSASIASLEQAESTVISRRSCAIWMN